MTWRTTRVATCLALSVSASGQLGCRTPATQTDLTITTTCPERIDRDLTLFVTRADGVRDEYVFENVRWDFEQTLTPARTDALSFSVEAVLRDDTVELDRMTILGEHVLGTRSERSLTLVDPACSSRDAGPDDAGTVDADTVDVGTDASGLPDAFAVGPRVSDALVVAYDFGEESGTRVRDCGPHGTDLVGVGGATITWTDGARFDVGYAESADIGAGWSEIVAADQFTIEAWVTLPTTAFLETDERNPIATVVAGDTGRHELVFQAFADGPNWMLRASVSTSRDTNGRPFVQTPVAYSDSPTHLAFVHRFDDALGTAEELIYVNGDAQTVSLTFDGNEPDAGIPFDAGAGWRQGSIPPVAATPARLQVANAEGWNRGSPATPPNEDQRFGGRYHLFVIHSRALTAEEIRTHAARGHLDDPCP